MENNTTLLEIGNVVINPNEISFISEMKNTQGSGTPYFKVYFKNGDAMNLSWRDDKVSRDALLLMLQKSSSIKYIVAE